MSTELVSPSNLLGKAWEVFTLRWKNLLIINLIPGALAAALVLFVIALLMVTGVFTGMQSGDTSKIAGMTLVLFPVFLLVYIAVILLSLWAQLASLLTIAQHEKPLKVKEAFVLAKGKIWPYFSTAFIVGLIIGVGYMLFVIPGIILGIWFSFAGFIVLNENKTGLTAALTSRGYLRGRFLAVFGRFALIGVIYVGIWLLFMGLQAALGDSDETALLSILVGIVSNVVFFVMNLIAIIYAYLLYEDVKRAHGGEVVIDVSTRKKYILFGIIGFVVSIVLVAVFVGSMISMMMSMQQGKNSPDAIKSEQMMELIEKDQSPYGDTSKYEEMMNSDFEEETKEPANQI